MDDWKERVRLLQSTGNPNGAAVDFSDWRRWGDTFTHAHTWLTALDEAIAIDVPNLVQARMHHPLAWIVGYSSSQNATDPDNIDAAQFTGRVRWGLGSSYYVQEQIVALYPAGGPAPPIVTFIGPGPAEALLLSGAIAASPNPAGTFPRTAVYTLGMWCAPQVW